MKDQSSQSAVMRSPVMSASQTHVESSNLAEPKQCAQTLQGRFGWQRAMRSSDQRLSGCRAGFINPPDGGTRSC
jgi:hypothetical protein